MNDQQRQMTEMLRKTFDAVSEGYDGKALRFFPLSADHLSGLLGLRGNEQVLDVACGTGHATIALARRLPQGRVTAVDLSPGMLEQARRKTASAGIGNAEFLERDMQVPGFAEGSFDVAVCAFGIFFVMDMEAQLARIASMVKPGGRIAITTFQDDYFQPLRDRFFGQLSRFSAEDPPQAWKRVATEAGCRQFFASAGLQHVRVELKNVGYYLAGADEWWDIVWNAGFRRFVARLSAADQERFKREHLEEIAMLGTDKGIWLDVNVLFTIGTKQ